MDLGQILLMIFFSSFIGFSIGIIFTVRAYKRNRVLTVLPGQSWYLPSAGCIKIVHSATPGNEILYVYNFENGFNETAMGTCGRAELIKNGVPLETSMIDPEDNSEDDSKYKKKKPDLKILEFPSNRNETDDE